MGQGDGFFYNADWDSGCVADLNTIQLRPNTKIRREDGDAHLGIPNENRKRMVKTKDQENCQKICEADYKWVFNYNFLLLVFEKIFFKKN